MRSPEIDIVFEIIAEAQIGGGVPAGCSRLRVVSGKQAGAEPPPTGLAAQPDLAAAQGSARKPLTFTRMLAMRAPFEQGPVVPEPAVSGH
jgi:hypothetical protein